MLGVANFVGTQEKRDRRKNDGVVVVVGVAGLILTVVDLVINHVGGHCDISALMRGDWTWLVNTRRNAQCVVVSWRVRD